MTRSRVMLAGFVLLLVILAFARAHYASSTGIRIVGDGSDYESVAAAMRLEGRAPFVYRPAVPLIVGALFRQCMNRDGVLTQSDTDRAGCQGDGVRVDHAAEVALLWCRYVHQLRADRPTRPKYAPYDIDV